MIRARYPLLAGLLLLSLASCKREDNRFATATGTSAFLDDASPEAHEALSIQVDYILTDRNFAQWEAAQRNLDRLPRSAFPAVSTGAPGNAIDRAVARLESSPRARSTIEATGLTVRDFVLQTVALAQATEAAQGGRPAGAGVVPPENFRFVDRYRERIRRAQAAARTARRNQESADMQIDSGQQAGMEEGREADTSVNAETAADADTGIEASPPPPPDTTRDSLSVEQQQ